MCVGCGFGLSGPDPQRPRSEMPKCDNSKGAVVVWTGSADPSGKEGGIDPTVMPVGLRAVAGDAQIQPPFTLPFRRGDRVLTVGWAILRPQPAFARH